MIKVNIKLPRKNFDVIINETFPDGITGIFGPSGSGKTSLMQAISGLAPPVIGTIKVQNRVLFDSDKRINVPVEQRNIGYVFQEGRLFPHMNVQQNLLYGYKPYGANKVTFEEVVNMLQLNHLLQSKPTNISGGERQRTALGRALLSSPDILLLDEPFSAVDTNLRKQILPFILRIRKLVQIPVLIVSHELPDLLKLTKNIMVIKNGQCLGHDNYQNLLKLPEISALLGSSTLINTIELEVNQNKTKDGFTLNGYTQGQQHIVIYGKSKFTQYHSGQKVKIYIHADDISLATSQLPQTTIQNQLKGKVTEVISRGETVFCIIDTGTSLLAEISKASQLRMDIKRGTDVYCLFKAVAIEAID